MYHRFVLACVLMIASAAAAQNSATPASPGRQSLPRPREEPAGRTTLLPDPVPARVEFTPAAPRIDTDAPFRSDAPLRYHPSDGWEGVVTISETSLRRHGKASGRGRGILTETVLRVRLEPAPEPDRDGGRGFTVRVSLESFPEFGRGYPGTPQELEAAAGALAAIGAELHFSGRGILEYSVFTLPTDCPSEVEQVARRLEALLPLLVPPLPEGPPGTEGWHAKQYLASDPVWHHGVSYHYTIEDDGGGSLAVSLRGHRSSERPKDRSRIGNTPINADGVPYFPGPRGHGLLRIDLSCPIARYVVYSTTRAEVGKWPQGGQPINEHDITIRSVPLAPPPLRP